jgi:hypothetical protein
VSESMPHMSIDSVEIMKRPEIQASLIFESFNFGEGTISGETIDPETKQLVHETIISDREIIVPVDIDDDGKPIDDDGCGDGRGVKQIKRQNQYLKRSLNRPKVFGGSPIMTTGSRIGLGRGHGEALGRIVEDAVTALDDAEVDYGAHTDEHAHGENCGCGAIDRLPEAVLASVKYENYIRHIIADLGVSTENIDEVYGNFREYVSGTLPYHPEYSGRKTMDMIEGAGKVVKELAGTHSEVGIVLNMIKGYTVNQALIRDKTDRKAQVFGVDVWRLLEINEKLYPDDSEKQLKALQSQLILMLGISAVLTKGDLPVYLVEAKTSPVVA